MKKEWNNPTIKDLFIQDTKEEFMCPYETAFLPTGEGKLTAEECCPCEFYQRCSKPKKYDGPCIS